MKKILLIGAGKSSSSLIKYLLDHAIQYNWELTIAEMSVELAESKINNHPRGRAVLFDATNDEQRAKYVSESDIVVSMLPAFMHDMVALDCVKYKKHLVTASYVSNVIQNLDEEAKKAGILLLSEIGLDPGIDHMSAMQIIDKLKSEGANITAFESFTGGLVAPESDNNPWGYKFTWNPRNVVIAGQGVCKFIEEGEYKYIPYQKVFRRTEMISIDGYGDFVGYANRDSLKYRDVYGLSNIPTLYRGTLRRPGFCRAWDVFVQLGATDDTYIVEGAKDMTARQFINAFLPYHPSDSVELKLAQYVKIDLDSEEMRKLKWLGIFEDEPINYGKDATPAQILQHILEKKWALAPNDKDMVVMFHKFKYVQNNQLKELHSSMVVIGENQTYTAMAKTVGLPMAIAIKLILQGKITTTGVKLPVEKSIYEPVLKELTAYGITFSEKQINIDAKKQSFYSL